MAKKTTGGSGKNYTFGSNGSITVSRPDGTTSTVNKGDKNYNSTVSSMNNDGVRYPSNGSGSVSNTSTSKPTQNNVSSTGGAYKPTYGGNTQTGFYKVNQDGSKTAMTDSNKKYFPSNYGGNAGNFTYTPSRQEAPMQNGKVAGEAGFGNSTSVFQKTNDNWISDQFSYNNGQWTKNGNAVELNEKTSAHLPSYIRDMNGNLVQTNATGNFGYDEGVKSTYGRNTEHRISENRLTDALTDSRENIDSGYANYNIIEQEALDLFKNNKDAYEKFKAELNTDDYTNNFFNMIEGTMSNSNNMMGMGAISLADDTVQNDVAYLIYDTLQKAGVEGLDGMSGLEIANIANSMGLGALLDPNTLNKPYIENQLVDNTNAHNKENDVNEKYDFNINSKEIVDALIQSGGINNLLAEGYEVKEDGTIAPKDGYIQWGDTLVDKMEYLRNGHNLQGYSDNRRQSEKYMQQETKDTDFMYKEPLEYRAKYAPETMTPEMQQDLQYERELKTELDSLMLELQMIDEILGGGAMSGLSTGGSGAVVGSGNGGTGNVMQNAIGRAVGGGNTEVQGVTGTGKGSLMGNAYGYNTNTIKQYLGR